MAELSLVVSGLALVGSTFAVYDNHVGRVNSENSANVESAGNVFGERLSLTQASQQLPEPYLKSLRDRNFVDVVVVTNRGKFTLTDVRVWVPGSTGAVSVGQRLDPCTQFIIPIEPRLPRTPSSPFEESQGVVLYFQAQNEQRWSHELKQPPVAIQEGTVEEAAAKAHPPSPMIARLSVDSGELQIQPLTNC